MTDNEIKWCSLYGDDSSGKFAGRFSGCHPTITSPSQKFKTDLPQILIMSDSIVSGHCLNIIRSLLRNKAYVNYIQHPHHCKGIEKWLNNWDIDKCTHYHTLFFFDGMHGFPPRVSEDEHRELTPKLVERMKKIFKNVIWGNCTPLPNMKQGVKNSALGPNSKEQTLTNESVINRNKSLKIEMEETNTNLIDLYSLLKPIQNQVQPQGDSHFNQFGTVIIGTAITHELLKTL